jgi:hypothetical protein
MMYSEPEEDTIQGMKYKIKDIKRIRTADVGKVTIETKMEDVYTHRKGRSDADEYTIVELEVIPADKKDVRNTIRLIK